VQNSTGYKWPHPVGDWGIGLPINEHTIYECDLQFHDVEWWINHCKWKNWWKVGFAHEMRQVADSMGFAVAGRDSVDDAGCDDPLYREYNAAVRAQRGPLGVVTLGDLLDEPTFEQWAEARS
jgi:hypothetical protein